MIFPSFVGELERQLQARHTASQHRQYASLVGNVSNEFDIPEVHIPRAYLQQLALALKEPSLPPVMARRYRRLLYRLLDLLVSTDQNNISKQAIVSQTIAAFRAPSGKSLNELWQAMYQSPLERAEAFKSLDQLGALLVEQRASVLREQNECARRLGFPNYIDLQLRQYDLSASEVESLALAFEEESRPAAQRALEIIYSHVDGEREYKDLTWIYSENYRRLCPSIALQKAESIGKDLASMLGLSFPKIRFEYLPSAGTPGRCFYFQVPNDIRVVMSGVCGYQLLRNCLHELGHVLYMTHITRKEFVFRTNLGAFDEAMAMFFGGLIDIGLEIETLLPLGLHVPSIAYELGLHVLYGLRFLAANAYFIVRAYRETQADLSAIYKETFERFALLPCQSKHLWTLTDANGYPAYTPYAFTGTLIGYQLLAYFRKDGLTLHEVGNVLQTLCYPEGEALSWRDKLKNITGELLSPKPICEILTMKSI